MFPHSAEILEAEGEEEEEVEEKEERVGVSKIVIDNAYGKNDDEGGGSDMLVGLDET